ncbi:MAG: HEAT repeat domain-containing protein [Candidatus Marinimicrobia bacterium]|nr:HEAT repeat domain-containing protein [Candidatus Neomarinimicrobiota bacterium]MBT3574987.1 HEAT repeat domain-containing protein [Candidatus Neomarinimicrobiota bacterium]MBT3679209.1 HEAT repeat domain-containing protein [Candidatus Neomarinimicrobiota bacterium]MBT4131262.1 HEAT repeat domain-containing protein [Candidatus Neomarinimicrobiota bacterium]MBT4253619.1 HEAT repeat domain-containing protein [Candidatus Neomarinimicrobiota bacterium]
MNSEQFVKYLKQVIAFIKGLGDEFFSNFEKLPRLEMAMQILILTVVFLFVLTIIIAVGVVLLRMKNNLISKKYSRLEKSWEGQIMEALSRDEDEDFPDMEISRRDRDFFVQYLYRFASRLRGQELQIIKDLAQPYLAILAKKLKRGYPELRARNINILATLGFPEFIVPIIDALKEDAPIVKMAAARILAHKDYPHHIDLILPELSHFDEWSMNFLSSMLSEMGPSIAPRLREELLNHEASVRVRIAAAEALRQIGDLAAPDAAVTVLETGDDPELSATCLKILRDMGTPRHRPLLLDLVGSPEEIIRIHALSALGSVGLESDATIMLKGLDDPSSWVALQAARALHQIKSTQLLEELAASDHFRASIAQQILTEVNGL